MTMDLERDPRPVVADLWSWTGVRSPGPGRITVKVTSQTKMAPLRVEPPKLGGAESSISITWGKFNNNNFNFHLERLIQQGPVNYI